MKIGIITQPNEKGQIVIPKNIRDNIGIDSRTILNMVVMGNSLHIYPVNRVVTFSETENTYEKVLLRTQGKWGVVRDKANKKYKLLELKASVRRKKPW